MHSVVFYCLGGVTVQVKITYLNTISFEMNELF